MIKNPPAVLTDAEYARIEDALLSSVKGSRFLRVYLERNQSQETQRLFRSIARLHRATVGDPDFTKGIKREVADMLRTLARLREAALLCMDDETRSSILTSGLHQVEAALMSLSETLEEGPHCEMETKPQAENETSPDPRLNSAKLFCELSSFFAAEPQFGPTRL